MNGWSHVACIVVERNDCTAASIVFMIKCEVESGRRFFFVHVQVEIGTDTTASQTQSESETQQLQEQVEVVLKRVMAHNCDDTLESSPEITLSRRQERCWINKAIMYGRSNNPESTSKALGAAFSGA